MINKFQFIVIRNCYILFSFPLFMSFNPVLPALVLKIPTMQRKAKMTTGNISGREHREKKKSEKSIKRKSLLKNDTYITSSS